MKKRKFIIVIFILSVVFFLSFQLINYSTNTLSCILENKTDIIINIDEDTNYKDIVSSLNKIAEENKTDIMILFRDLKDDKMEYVFYKTNINENFFKLPCENNSIFVYGDDALSEKDTDNSRKIYNFNLSKHYITIKNIEHVTENDLSYFDVFIENDKYDDMVKAFCDNNISCQKEDSGVALTDYTIIFLIFSIVLGFFSFSIIYYAIWLQKDFSVKRSLGIAKSAIIFLELKNIIIKLTISIVIIYLIFTAAVGIIFGVQSSILFVSKTFFGIIIFFAALLAAFAISFYISVSLSGIKQLKGKKQYSILSAFTFFVRTVLFIVVLVTLSMSISKVIEISKDYKMLKTISKKAENYYLTKVYALYENPDDNSKECAEKYLSLYNSLYDNNNCILFSSSGREFGGNYYNGKPWIYVNDHFIDICDVFDLKGNKIVSDDIPDDKLVFLLPGDNYKVDYSSALESLTEFEKNHNKVNENDILYLEYNPEKSKLYSFDINRDRDVNGVFSDVVIEIMNSKSNVSLVTCLPSYFSNRIMFESNGDQDAYNEILPLLKTNKLDRLILKTPSVSSDYEESISIDKQYLKIWCTISLFCICMLLVMIVYSCNLYILNNQKQIACKMMQGLCFFDVFLKRLVLNAAVIPLSVLVSYYVWKKVYIYSVICSVVLVAAECLWFYLISKKQMHKNIIDIVKGA